MKGFLFICLILIHLFDVSALDINGSAPGYEGKFARLYLVSDFISFHEQKVDVVKIGVDGNFILKCQLSQAKLLKIKISDISLSLIATPEMNLHLKLTYDEDLNLGRVYDKSFTVEILDNSDFDINESIWEYQKSYAAFLEENHSLLVTKKILPEVHKFQIEMQNKYATRSAEYFRTYLEYDLAALEDAVLGSERTLYDVYIRDRGLLYHNMGYMAFFTQFYQQRFIQISHGKQGFELLSSVNGTQDYDKLKGIVREHEFAGNDTITELFIIQGLKEVYGDETFKKQKVLSMLKYISNHGINTENQRIAANIVKKLTFLLKGSEAPNFNLRDISENVHHLSEQRKNVLLFFWSVNSPTCLREMQFLEEYKEKYSENLVVIGINIDDNVDKAENYMMKQRYTWLSLYKDRQNDVTDKYRVYGVPMYVLMDDRLHILQYPAKRPEENLESVLFRLSSEH